MLIRSLSQEPFLIQAAAFHECEADLFQVFKIFNRIAVGNDDICLFAFFNRAQNVFLEVDFRRKAGGCTNCSVVIFVNSQFNTEFQFREYFLKGRGCDLKYGADDGGCCD